MDERNEIHLADVLSWSGRATRAIAHLSRQAAGIAIEEATDTTRQIVKGIREREDPDEIASHLVDGWVSGARRILGVDHPASANGEDPDPATQLHRQGAELMARSNQISDDSEYPAFQTILAQVSPDEARIIRVLAKEGSKPVVDVFGTARFGRHPVIAIRNFSLIGVEAAVLHRDRMSTYLENLARLRIVTFVERRVSALEEYELLEAQPEVAEAVERLGRTSRKCARRGVELTDFGKSFYQDVLET